MIKKYNTKKVLFSLMISITLFISCTKEDVTKPDIPDIIDNSGVHIVGTNPSAYHWKDGIGSELATKDFSEARSVYVSGNDVYVAGWSFENTFRATYWKNGVAHLLTDENTRSEGYSIFVKDTCVYVSGIIIDNADNAVYWKNNQLFELQHKSDKYQTSCGNSVYVKDSNVYVVGSSTYFNQYSVGLPVYWLNGIIHQLPGETTFGSANSVFVTDNNDVYIAGEASNRPVYWKNGIFHLLKYNNRMGGANSIFVTNNDVYVAGWDVSSAGRCVAKYWKNDIPVVLYDSTKFSVAKSIFVKDTVIYVAGEDAESNNNVSKGAYWKNGILIELTSGIKYGEANSIYVK